MSKVHFIKLEHNKMLSNESMNPQDTLSFYKELCRLHAEALRNQKPEIFTEQNENIEFVIPCLELRNSYFLCGIFSVRQSDIGATIHEVNPSSQETIDIKPSVSTNKFEKFTYFVINIKNNHLAFLYNENARTNTHKKIRDLLMRIHSDVVIRTNKMVDTEFINYIKNKKISITGALKPEKSENTKSLPAISKLKTLTGEAVNSTVWIKIKRFTPNTDKKALDIFEYDYSDDFDRLKMELVDKDNGHQENVDLIEKALILKRELKLTDEQAKDKNYVWSQLINMCNTL